MFTETLKQIVPGTIALFLLEAPLEQSFVIRISEYLWEPTEGEGRKSLSLDALIAFPWKHVAYLALY